MIHLFKKYFRLSGSEKIILLQLFVLSFYTFILIKFYSVKKVFTQLQQLKIKVNNKKNINIPLIIKNIHRVSKYAPWRCKCFEQAVMAKIYFSSKGIITTIQFGIKKEGNELVAHAWLLCNNLIVLGERNYNEFTTIYKI
jgi:hypothetical protein